MVSGGYKNWEEQYPGSAQAAVWLMLTLFKLNMYLEIIEIDYALGVASYYRSGVSTYERLLLSL